MKVLLAGEGRSDLGDWSGLPEYRPERPGPGVVEALARRVCPGSWEIGESVQWKDIRKYGVGGHRSAEERNVLGVALKAHELGYDAILFSRDSDGSQRRVEQVEDGIGHTGTEFPEIGVAGGCAVRCLESWLLALQGQKRTESRGRAKTRLQETGIEGTAAMVESVEQADLDQIPADAKSLRRWLERARTTLPT